MWPGYFFIRFEFVFRKVTPCLSHRIFFPVFVNLMKFRLLPILNHVHTNAQNGENCERIANYHLWGASVLSFLVIVHHTWIAPLLFLTFRFDLFFKEMHVWEKSSWTLPSNLWYSSLTEPLKAIRIKLYNHPFSNSFLCNLILVALKGFFLNSTLRNWRIPLTKTSQKQFLTTSHFEKLGLFCCAHVCITFVLFTKMFRCSLMWRLETKMLAEL